MLLRTEKTLAFKNNPTGLLRHERDKFILANFLKFATFVRNFQSSRREIVLSTNSAIFFFTSYCFFPRHFYLGQARGAQVRPDQDRRLRLRLLFRQAAPVRGQPRRPAWRTPQRGRPLAGQAHQSGKVGSRKEQGGSGHPTGLLNLQSVANLREKKIVTFMWCSNDMFHHMFKAELVTLVSA